MKDVTVLEFQPDKRTQILSAIVPSGGGERMWEFLDGKIVLVGAGLTQATTRPLFKQLTSYPLDQGPMKLGRTTKDAASMTVAQAIHSTSNCIGAGDRKEASACGADRRNSLPGHLCCVRLDRHPAASGRPAVDTSRSQGFLVARHQLILLLLTA